MKPTVHDDDAVRLIELSLSNWTTQAIGTFAEVGIADAFGPGPTDAADLAAAVACDEPALRRLLRSLAAVGLVSEGDSGQFRLTTMGEFLRTDHPRSLRKLAILQTESWIWEAFQVMPTTIREGVPGMRYIHGVDEYWTYLDNTPRAQAVFNEGMVSLARNLQIPMALSYDYGSLHRILDVGGGLGEVLAAVLEANPHLDGTLFDLPATVAEAKKRLDLHDLSSRCTTVGGDMFAKVPKGADGYLLSGVLLDWDDERAGLLLRNIAEVLPADGRILVVDCLLDLDPEGAASQPYHLGRTVDLFELCMGSARVRTQQEFVDLADGAGLRLTRVIQPQGPVSLLEMIHQRRVPRSGT